MDLLAWAWDNGPLPKSESERARLSGISRHKFKKVWQEISRKWIEGAEGFCNQKQEQQRSELQEFRQTKSTAGKKGAESRWHSHASANGKAVTNDSSSFCLLPSSKDQDQRVPAPRSIKERRRHIRRAIFQKLNEQPQIDLGELADYVKDLGRPLGFTWNTSDEIHREISSVQQIIAKGGQP
jgi:uncharacterized protein YdaU (DUF1376 family)